MRKRDQLGHYEKYGRRSYLKNKSSRMAGQKAWRNRNPDKIREYNLRYKNKSLAGYILRSTRGNAKRRGLECVLTKRWLQEKLDIGCCEVTKLKFDLTGGTRSRKRPFTPSIDRKDPNVGYTEPNCRLVIWAYNAAKST